MEGDVKHGVGAANFGFFNEEVCWTGYGAVEILDVDFESIWLILGTEVLLSCSEKDGGNVSAIRDCKSV